MKRNKKQKICLLLLLLVVASTVQAAVIPAKTKRSVGETVTIALNKGVAGRVQWSTGDKEQFTSNGTPMQFEVKADSFVIYTTGKIRELWISNNKLTLLNISAFKASLEKLYCYNNELEELDLEGCNGLVELNCADNRLTELTVESTVLNALNVQNNRLTSLSLPRSFCLQSLVCSNNDLQEMPAIESGSKLRQLWMSGVKADTINLELQTSLYSLIANGCDAKQIVWNTNSSSTLQFVDIANNRLYFDSMPTIYNTASQTYTLLAIVAPQEPFFLTDDVVVGERHDWKNKLNLNGWGKTIAAVSTLFDGNGNMLEEGTDYKVSLRRYTFLQEKQQVVLQATSKYYPDMILTSQPFDVVTTTGINLTPTLSHEEEVLGIYDLQGHRIGNSHLTKGLYIFNGKKIMIK